MASRTVTVQLTNDQSGKNADVPVSADGHDHSISSLWANTSVSSGGKLLVTSAQLVANFQGATVVIKQGNQTLATLNDRETFAKVGSNSAGTDLEHAAINAKF